MTSDGAREQPCELVGEVLVDVFGTEKDSDEEQTAATAGFGELGEEPRSHEFLSKNIDSRAACHRLGQDDAAAI